jgi:hypothetical protein
MLGPFLDGTSVLGRDEVTAEHFAGVAFCWPFAANMGEQGRIATTATCGVKTALLCALRTCATDRDRVRPQSRFVLKNLVSTVRFCLSAHHGSPAVQYGGAFRIHAPLGNRVGEILRSSAGLR